MGTVFFLIFALVIAVLAVIFALQNSVTVTISFMAWEVTGSLSLVLLITLAIGALIGLLVLAPSVIKHSMAAANGRKRIRALEKQVDEHKARITDLEKPTPVPASPEPSTTSSLPASPADAPQPSL